VYTNLRERGKNLGNYKSVVSCLSLQGDEESCPGKQCPTHEGQDGDAM